MASDTRADADLTRAQRADLQRIARMRARQSRTLLDARRAELAADLEEQLAARFPSNDPRWAAVTRQAQETVAQANEVISAAVAEQGLPPEFAPSLSLVWYSRGESASVERRTELRRLGAAKLDALVKVARATIDSTELEACTSILADGLRSDQAREYLERIPQPAQLMAPISLDEVEVERAALKAERDRDRRLALGTAP